MAHKANLRICLTISMFFLTMAGPVQAATITVGSVAGYDFDTIQAGIDAAVDGDTVLVAPGEYVITEPITFRGKAITAKSETGPDETTIRMGTPADTNRGSVVVFENSETTASVLEGFTITGGVSSWVSAANAYGGGGIYFDASSGSLFNCAVVKNRADDGGGGGVSAGYGSSPILTNCIFTGNSATWGGGVLGWINSSITMTNCIISGNSSLNLGGGVYGGSNSSITMTNCTIISNTVQDAGAGIVCDSSSAVLTNCVIAQNTGARWGGGLCSGYALSSITISNCTIWGNSATEGGGVGCLNGGSVTVTNSILWGNKAARGNEIYLEQAPTEFSVVYSNVAGGQAGVNVQGGSTLDWGEGNIDADPCFADPNNGDYHLKSQAGRWDLNSQTWVMDDFMSPCIDAGDPNSDWTAELWPHGERINMGAYGGTSQASRSLSDAGNVGDLNRDGIVDSADMRIIVDHWGTDEPLCDIGPVPFGDGIVDIQDLIVLAEHLFEEREE